MAKMLGYEPEEMVGRSVFDFYFPEDVEHKKQLLSRRQQGLRELLEERLQRRDGSGLWVRMAATPVFKDNGQFDGALAMVCDITERKIVEEALRESEARFRLVANAAPVLIWMSGTNELCDYFNDPLASIHWAFPPSGVGQWLGGSRPPRGLAAVPGNVHGSIRQARIV
jgi:PAS domain S-box-containing protein